MGIPDVVDFARNFAVIVRLQGPDPKGLKMRKHAFHHYHSGKTTISASGMLLPDSLYNVSVANECFRGDNDGNLTLVVTVASIIEPFLSLAHRNNTVQGRPDLIPGAQIDIMLEGDKRTENSIKKMEKGNDNWIPAKLLRLVGLGGLALRWKPLDDPLPVDVPSSSSALQSIIEASSGLLQHGWEVGSSLSSPNYAPRTFADVAETQSQRHSAAGETSDPNLMAKSSTRIAVLEVPSIVLKDLPSITLSTSDKRGSFIIAMGSPFGILSPLHFFNSVSEGSVSNYHPPSSSSRALLMADIRCLPGMEGGPVFNDQAHLIGILTRPLRQKAMGAEIQLVIPWEAVGSACSDLFPKVPYTRTGIDDATKNFLCSRPRSDELGKCDGASSLVENALPSICLITLDDGAWASGILLNKHGLILTNAHLLEPWRFRKTTSEDKHHEYNISLNHQAYRRIRVRVNHDPWIWCNARIVHISRGPLDVALLQINSVPDQLCPIDIDFSCPAPGSNAYVIGHGLFGPRCDLSPSISCGLVAKVVKSTMALSDSHPASPQENSYSGFPTMIETTAAVHPGGSGGAVVNSNGHLIGLVTSNARHGGGTVIPHLNFSIPCAALVPIFKFSEDMQDLSLLQELDKPNEHLSSVWALISPLSPNKPDPLFPNLPQLPVEYNKKDGKGSRFAKFIAERPAILKGSSQLDKATNDLLPSKL